MCKTKAEKLAYLLGALRDGGIGTYIGYRKKDYRIYVSQYKPFAEDWLETIKGFFIDLFNKHVTGPIKGVLSISNKELFKFFELECGVYPNGKKWLTPQWIYYASKDVKIAYVKGVFDADGSIFRKRKFYEIQISQGSKKFLEEIRNILYEFDIKSSVCKSKDIFKIDISAKTRVKKFITKIGSLHPNHLLKIEKALDVGRKLDLTPDKKDFR